MNVTVTGRHMDLTDALKTYVMGGLDKLKTHFDRVIDADVVLSIEKHRQIAEVNLHANGIRIHGKETSSDMYASVDAVLQKIDKQVRRYKDRINRHQPLTAKEERAYQHHVIELGEEAAVQTAEHKVVFREKVPLRPMQVDEAAMQLELVEVTFLLFLNVETQQINLIYARGDGTYGVIEPQAQ